MPHPKLLRSVAMGMRIAARSWPRRVDSVFGTAAAVSRCCPFWGAQTFVEELVRLPGCFLCYSPALEAPPVAPLPAAEAGFVTFGSFNNLAKITPEVRGNFGFSLK